LNEVVKLILAATLGSLLTFLIQSFYSFRAQQIAHVNDFLTDLSRIEQLSIKYWLIKEGSDVDDQRKLAVELRGALHATAHFLADSPRLLSNDHQKFAELDGRLFDATTGGQFEALDKDSDPERVVDVMQICCEIRALVRRSRWKFYWAR
jgi:hypothetical protein